MKKKKRKSNVIKILNIFLLLCGVTVDGFRMPKWEQATKVKKTEQKKFMVKIEILLLLFPLLEKHFEFIIIGTAVNKEKENEKKSK